MFLRNYDNYIWLLHCFAAPVTTSTLSISTSSYFEDGKSSTKTTSGTIYTNGYIANASSSSTYMKPPFCLKDVSGICLGDGNTAVTYDDYKLSGNLVTNKLVKVSTSNIWNSDTKKYTQKLVATYTNSGSTDVTISEWGLWRAHTTTDTSVTYSNSSNTSVLTFREVLDEPIVIEAGTTATLTFSVDIPMPNHP